MVASSSNQDKATYQEQPNGFWGVYDVATLVAYAALLTELEANRGVYRLTEALESNTTPARWLTLKIIEGLIDQGLINAEPHLYAPECKLVLKHSNEDEQLKSIFDELSSKRVDYMDKKFLSITRAYLKADLQAHIAKQLNKVGIELTIAEGDFETFATTLERRSLAELYMIVWQTVQNLSPPNLRFLSLSESSGGIASQVEDSFLETLNGYEARKRTIKPFQFTMKTRPSLSLVIFNSVLDIKQSYFTKSLSQIWNEYA